MPAMSRPAPDVAPDAADDHRTWRPQLARETARPSPVRDPILEPDWDGIHVLAHFELGDPEAGAPSVALIDVDGDDQTAAHTGLGEAIGRAVLAIDAVIDGVITEQALRTGIGAAIIHKAQVPRTALLTARDVGVDVDAKLVARGEGLAFVAVDLLRLDGQSLLDLPLLERKRLLDAVIEQGDLVRVSPYTRPPIAPWLASWKSTGFRGAIVKASNSRYRPGSATDEWTLVSKLHGR
jgi:ATP-dependent DNA ligase